MQENQDRLDALAMVKIKNLSTAFSREHKSLIPKNLDRPSREVSGLPTTCFNSSWTVAPHKRIITMTMEHQDQSPHRHRGLLI